MKILKDFYEWGKWPGIMHNILFLLLIYIIYVFIAHSQERNTTNLLLFSIILGIDIIIHQIINIRNQKTTAYL